MGCGTSRSSEVDKTRPTGQGCCTNTKENNGAAKSIKNKENDRTVKEPSAGADLPGSVPDGESDPMPPPVSFEIPVVAEESIIKKHPPKRLQKLEDQQLPVSQDHLIEKQQNAEERRQRVLQERVQSSRRSASRLTRKMPSKDLAIPEFIEHEKSIGSPRKAVGVPEHVEF